MLRCVGGSGVRGEMNRFVSNYTLRLDAKGRVSIPAPFRQVLARDGFDGLYAYPTLDRPARLQGPTFADGGTPANVQRAGFQP